MISQINDSSHIDFHVIIRFFNLNLKMYFCCCHMTPRHSDIIIIYINYNLMSNIFERYNPGVGFTKGFSLDLDLKSRHLSLNHAKFVVLDSADSTKQQLLSFD